MRHRQINYANSSANACSSSEFIREKSREKNREKMNENEKKTRRSMANVEQRVTLERRMFDKVMLNARRNSIVLLFILCIFR